MKNLCPNFDCLSPCFIRDGFFTRKEDSKRIQRFKCKACGLHFSSATYSPFYKQQTRRINAPLFDLFSSNISQRRAALLLKIDPKTVARKLPVLAMVARLKNKRLLMREEGKVHDVQMDDLITKENTKLKPLSVTIVADKASRRILATSVSIIPAFGHLAKMAVDKYGFRPDEHHLGIERVMKEIKPFLGREPLFETDEHKRYPYFIKKYFPSSEHKTYKSERACVAGQGELKKVHFDPLFVINHTCAMLRANINRLIRKTWCTTKSIERLKDHIDIFVYFYHAKLLQNTMPKTAMDGGS